jgi:tRNA A-37 threonylcarbamoyl transferase component Bud32
MHVLASEIEGTVLAGLRIEAVIGRGGMGVVYRATQLDLDRTVAVKVIAAELLDDDAARSRFVQESRLAASIDHPHVIPIHAAGEEDGVPYLVMQYVAGDDARSLVHRAGPIAPARAARIVAQVGDALDAAHAAGLVHRDVKPANVLLAAGEHAYLSDFGLTRRVRSISGGPTGSGQWVGTLDYVAPEQIRGGQVDARADVYALGCVLFFLLTGEVPFPRDSDEARLWAHLTEPPRRISAVASAVPRAFDTVIERALAKAPDDRYPSAGDLGRAAVAAAVGARVTAPERAVAIGDAAPTESPTRTSNRPRPRRRPWLAAPAGFLAGIAALLLWPLEESARVAAQPTPTASPTHTESPAPPRRPVVGPRLAARVRVGRRPNALEAVGRRMWVGSYATTNLEALDLRTARPIKRLGRDVGAGVADLAVARGRLWAATRDNQLVQLSPVDGRPTGPPVALPMEPVVVAAQGDDVVTGVEFKDEQIRTAQLIRVDAETGMVQTVATVSYGMAGAMYWRGWLWTLRGEPNFIVRRDPETLLAKQRIDLPGTTVGSLTHGAGAVWATIPDQDLLVRYRPSLRQRAEVEVGARPIGVQISNGRAWVASNGSSTLESVSVKSLRHVGKPLRLPLNPFTVLAGRDRLWIACIGESLIARVELRS